MSFACIRCGARLENSGVRVCPKCAKAVLLTFMARFELRQALSIGKEVVSFKGYDRKSGKLVFIRVLLPTATKATLEQLLRESSFFHDCGPDDPFPVFRDAGRIRETGGAYLAVDYVEGKTVDGALSKFCLLYTSPSPRD